MQGDKELEDAPATPVKGKGKRGRKPKAAGTKKAKSVASHPKYLEMVVNAITELNEREGTSKIGIVKFIEANYDIGKDPKLVNTHLKIALKRGVAKGILKQAKGQGAAGSFKLSESAEPLPQATTKRTKKNAAKKARKPASPITKKAAAPAPKSKPKPPPATPKKVAAIKTKPAAVKKSPGKKASPKKAKPAKKSPAKKGKSPKRKASSKKGKK